VKALFAVVVLIASLFSSMSLAADFPVQGRVFIGGIKPNFGNVNQELRALGLEEIGLVPMLGAEVTYAVLPFLEVGLNYSKRANVRKTSSANANGTYQSELDQDVALAVVRVPFIKTGIVRLDVFAGVGGANTTLKIKSATQAGELSKRDGKEFFASIASRYGASAAVGFRGFYFFFEGGMESNKVDSPTRTGTAGANIQYLDFTGPYSLIGLHIDGATLTKK
jgi:hypothetical protein